MKIRPNPIFPSVSISDLSRELSVLWRELSSYLDSSVASTTSSTGQSRNRNGVDTTDDVIIEYPSGLVLQDSDGIYWRVTISTIGELVTTELAEKP